MGHRAPHSCCLGSLDPGPSCGGDSGQVPAPLWASESLATEGDSGLWSHNCKGLWVLHLPRTPPLAGSGPLRANTKEGTRGRVWVPGLSPRLPLGLALACRMSSSPALPLRETPAPASSCLGGPRPCCCAPPPPQKPRQGNYFWNKSSYTTNELFIFGHGGEEAFCWAS